MKIKTITVALCISALLSSTAWCMETSKNDYSTKALNLFLKSTPKEQKKCLLTVFTELQQNKLCEKMLMEKLLEEKSKNELMINLSNKTLEYRNTEQWGNAPGVVFFYLPGLLFLADGAARENITEMSFGAFLLSSATIIETLHVKKLNSIKRELSSIQESLQKKDISFVVD